ncbi:MAG: hypothetical protein K2Q10_13740, partial [Rhodospirillales bacterium]|nr:hypothetical protein [Rhodospirillales bacterium]
ERRDDLRRRRQGLDAARVAAGRLADQALKLAGAEVRPLHEVVDSLGLDAARCEVVLTHFSALLFAPVAADADAAHAAAARLEAAGLEVPVLVAPDLAEFCRFGHIIARPDSGDAHGWMLGLRSPAVRCLLDAAQTEAEKARLEAELAELATRLDALAKALADLTPDSPAGRLIAAALTAGEAKAEARLAQTEAERAIIEAALPDLERRAAEPAREAIRAMRDFETLGGMEALAQSRTAAEEAEAQLEELDERLPELEERVSPEARAAIRAALDFARRGGNERLERLAEERAGLSARKSAFAEEARRRRFAGDAARLAVEAAEAELRRAAQALLVIPGLKDLAAFLAEDGPMVMAAAEERRERLDAALERAEARLLRFDFDLAQAYVDALAHGQEAEIENAAREAEATLETMRHQAAQARTRLDEARAEREHARDLARRLDEAALAALRQYRAARKAVEDLDPAALTEGGVTPALERARRVLAALADPEESDEDKVGRIEDLRADIAEFAIAERSKEIGALREAKDSAARQLTGEISRVLKLPELGLSDNEKHLLEEARGNPPRAQELHAHLERQYTENRSLHEKAVEALNERRLNLADNLKHMAARLALNYQLMRKALAWKVGPDGTLTEAGFELSANVTGEQQVGELIQEIIDAIELAEKRRREDEERGQTKLSRDQHAEHLKAQIRKAFYRRMFAEPSIRLRHPELKGGRGHVFDDRISTGQQNAVTLMLMLKLADYAIERDIRQHADSAQHRRRLRALAQKVVIIDGLFSNLTDRALIRQSMAAMAKVRGDFQLIGWIHNPLYQNNSEIFPTYVVARRMRRGEGGNYVYVEDGRIIEAETLGRREGEVDTMTFHVDQVPMPAAE